MDYNEAVELEKNIKIKTKAEKICRDFKNNTKLEMKNYEGNGRFVLWCDSNNKIYVDVEGPCPVFRCRFLHEEYDVVVNPGSVFTGIKNGYRGIDHLAAHATKTHEP